MMEDSIGRREFQSVRDEIWREIQRIREKLEGPPHPGLERLVNDFLIEFRTLERERAKQHKSSLIRLNIIIAGLAAVASCLMFFHH